MDTITLHQIKTQAHIGVSQEEQQNKQELLVDLTIRADAAQAAANDDINTTTDYASLYRFVIERVAASRVNLIETLAEKTACSILEQFPVSWLQITITKKPADLTDTAGVSITIERATVQP